MGRHPLVSADRVFKRFFRLKKLCGFEEVFAQYYLWRYATTRQAIYIWAGCCPQLSGPSTRLCTAAVRAIRYVYCGARIQNIIAVRGMQYDYCGARNTILPMRELYMERGDGGLHKLVVYVKHCRQCLLYVCIW